MKFRIVHFLSSDSVDPEIEEWDDEFTVENFAYFARLVCHTTGFLLVINIDNIAVFFCAGVGWRNVRVDSLITLYGFSARQT